MQIAPWHGDTCRAPSLSHVEITPAAAGAPVINLPAPGVARASRFNRYADHMIEMAGSAPALGTAAFFEVGWLAAGFPNKFSAGWPLATGDVSTVAVFWVNPILQNAENQHRAHTHARFREAVVLTRKIAILRRLSATVMRCCKPMRAPWQV